MAGGSSCSQIRRTQSWSCHKVSAHSIASVFPQKVLFIEHLFHVHCLSAHLIADCDEDAPAPASSWLLPALCIETEDIKQLTKIWGWMWQEKEKTLYLYQCCVIYLYTKVAKVGYWKCKIGLTCFTLFCLIHFLIFSSFIVLMLRVTSDNVNNHEKLLNPKYVSKPLTVYWVYLSGYNWENEKFLVK